MIYHIHVHVYIQIDRHPESTKIICLPTYSVGSYRGDIQDTPVLMPPWVLHLKKIIRLYIKSLIEIAIIPNYIFVDLMDKNTRTTKKNKINVVFTK